MAKHHTGEDSSLQDTSSLTLWDSRHLKTLLCSVLISCTVGCTGARSGNEVTNVSSLPNNLMADVEEKIQDTGGIRSGLELEDLRITKNNRVRDLLVGGPNIFERYAKLIEKARHEVLIAVYVWEHENTEAVPLIGEALKKVRASRPGEKVSVRILFSRRPFSENIEPVQASVASWVADGLTFDHINIELGTYRQTSFDNLHDKYIVVDGRHVVVTGANVQPKNNSLPSGGAFWQELGVWIEGETAGVTARSFDKKWLENTDAVRANQDPETGEIKYSTVAPSTPSRPFPGTDKKVGNTPVLAVPQDGLNRVPGFYDPYPDSPQNIAMLHLMNHARSSLWVVSPNISSSPFISATLRAARRLRGKPGAQVRVLYSAAFNNSFFNTVIAHLANMGKPNEQVVLQDFKKSEDWGSVLSARPYRNSRNNSVGANHAKIMVVDDRYVVAGSANQDIFAWYTSSEYNVLIDDPAFAKKVVRNLEDDWNASPSFDEWLKQRSQTELPEVSP